jgi:hypothetical protein
MPQDETGELVKYARDGNIVTLTLNRPEKLNAFNDDLVRALGDGLRRFDADNDAHIAIICGSGRAFSSGADVHQRQLRDRKEFERIGGPFERIGGPQAHGAHSADLLTRSVNWKPVIAAVHGYVLGLAIGIVFECDLVVAEEGTQFEILGTAELSRWRRIQHRNCADRTFLQCRGSPGGESVESRRTEGRMPCRGDGAGKGGLQEPAAQRARDRSDAALVP